jgi:NADPH-dependent curcumin reductase CurA
MAVQFTKLAGAYVSGTASTRNTEFLKEELGIDEIIDYTKTTIAEYMAPITLLSTSRSTA